MKASPVLKLTYDDFVQFPDDGKWHELIGGSHYVTPSPNTRHQTRGAGDVLTTPLLPGVELPLERIFRES